MDLQQDAALRQIKGAAHYLQVHLTFVILVGERNQVEGLQSLVPGLGGTLAH
jgi:hypothetical protein